MWWHRWTCGLWHSTIVYIDWKVLPITCREETVNEETASPTTGHETAISSASGGPTTQLRDYQEREKLMASEISCFMTLAFYQVRAVFFEALTPSVPKSTWAVSYTEMVTGRREWRISRTRNPPSVLFQLHVSLAKFNQPKALVTTQSYHRHLHTRARASDPGGHAV